MSLSDSSWSSLRLATFTLLLSLAVAFSVTDLLTTASALRDGLTEGNFLILWLSSALNVQLLSALGISKLVFIAGSTLTSIIGVNSRNIQVRRRMLLLMVSLVALLFLVSVNNLFWITSQV